ncbi:aKG-HExxH-type peptide beta-hydroxylase [Streptomyces sp. NBC_00005]|uniref:aKG-HExxH-type peptide beta-hydroxylase n=1 Tax=Streptomyces sp. NBC_00005 TaxID=2903609 RepID=UPI0032523B8F
MIAPYVIADAVFDALAAGEGGREAIVLLRRARRSRNLLLLRHVLDGPCGAAAQAGADLLSQVEGVAPETVKALLDGPSFGAWAAHAAADCPSHGDGICTAGDLAALAAVVAIRAGVVAEVAVPVRAGTLRLPGLGTVTGIRDARQQAVLATGVGTGAGCRDLPEPPATVDAGFCAGSAGVRSAPGAVDVRVPGDVHRLPRDLTREGHRWQPVAVLRAEHGGLTLCLPLETADPRLPALDTLRAGPVAWQGLLQSAWKLLVDSHRARAEELAEGLNGMVPLPAPARGVASATSRHAFGTVLASWPASPERLALTLLHEFQHSKLSALTDLVPLYEPGGPACLYAPWRPDPRPPGGLLQGIYAHLGDLAFWRARSGTRHEPEQADVTWRLARTRAQGERGLAEAFTHVRLTPLGIRFLERAAAAMGTVDGGDSGYDSDIGGGTDARTTRAVLRVEAGSEAVWRLRWAQVDEKETQRLAELWLTGRAAQQPPQDDVRAADGSVTGPGPEFGRWAARQRGAGRAGSAQEAAAAVVARPDRPERWAELAAAAAEEGQPGAGVLRHRTELVRNLLLHLVEARPDQPPPAEARRAEARSARPSPPAGEDRPPDPLALAAWLAVVHPRPPQPRTSPQNTGVSMSQNARSPLENTSATG